MFNNKHVIIALIVAPVLSVLAWYAVGNLIGETAAPAEAGASYPLVAKSNCRWSSGQCELENGDFLLTLRIDEQLRLLVESAHPLEGIVLEVFDPSSASGPDSDIAAGIGQPDSMLAIDEGRLQWVLQLDQPPTPQERIRLITMAAGARYYAEASTQFAQEAETTIPNPG